jgi:hypothetical protein
MQDFPLFHDIFQHTEKTSVSTIPVLAQYYEQIKWPNLGRKGKTKYHC